MKTEPSEIKREQWSSRPVFIMACIGSAIGLGNIWMFPWRMGTFGGSAFLIVYVLIVIFIGTAALMGEYALGRGRQLGPVGSMIEVFRSRKLHGGTLAGIIPVITTFVVSAWYTIVVGWVLHYLVTAFRGFGGVDLKALFDGFVGTPTALVWQAVAALIIGGITYLGVKKGLEPVNKFLMPALFVILVILVIRAVTLPGAMAGIQFMFTPDPAKFLEPLTWFHALAQCLFSLSVFGSILIVYGSYLPKDTDVPEAAKYTALFDTSAAILAAFIVFPAAYAFGIRVNAGIPLMFITLPGVLALMPGGPIFGVLFFLLVSFAALTSAISIFETAAIEPMMNMFKWNRKKATVITTLATFLAGVPLVLNHPLFLQVMSFSAAVLMPIGAFITMAAYFWIYGIDRAKEEINQGAVKPVGPSFNFFAKYLACGAMLFILVSGILRFTGLWR